MTPIKVKNVIVGERVRKDMGDIQSLADSIKVIGLLQPIGVTHDNTLVFGERRLRAFELLGINEIPARIISIDSILRGEHAENELRKDFTIAERVEIGRALEAEIGKRHGVNQHTKQDVENFPPPPEGKTRDIAGAAAGFGNGKTYEQAKRVVDEAPAEVVAAVERGDMAVSLAAEVTKLPGKDQAVVAATAPEEMREVARELVHNHRAQGTGENEWYTPQDYIESARTVLGRIDLDPASSDIAQQRVKSKAYYTKADNGLEKPWKGNVWLNPPYSQPEISQFVERLCEQVESGSVKQAIMLTHNYTDTRWFQRAAAIASAICFTRGRIAFESPDGKKAAPTQGQAFFYFGENSRAFVAEFAEHGFVVRVAAPAKVRATAA